jgi:WD40 repeat protein
MAEGPGQLVTTRSVRAFEDHKGSVLAVAVFPDGRRMVTGSADKTLHLWDLKNGVVLKNMEGNHDSVWAVVISRDGQVITSGGDKGELIAWHGVTGESLIKAIKAHSWSIFSLDFSPNNKVLATGSRDQTTKLWCTKTWKLQGNPIACCAAVYCVRYSPDGELLAIATFRDIQIWNPCTRDCIANFHAAISPANNISLVWTPDGRQLLSAGSGSDPTIRGWDSLTWNQVHDPWSGHTHFINAIAVNSAGTLVASASHDTYVRLWRLSDRRTISVFKHSKPVCCVTFSADGKQILSGGRDKKVLEWTVPEDALPVDVSMEHPLSIVRPPIFTPSGAQFSQGHLATGHLRLSPDKQGKSAPASFSLSYSLILM